MCGAKKTGSSEQGTTGMDGNTYFRRADRHKTNIYNYTLHVNQIECFDGCYKKYKVCVCSVYDVALPALAIVHGATRSKRTHSPIHSHVQTH